MEPSAIVSLVAGGAGLLVSNIGSLIPARKDFIGTVALKRAATMERLAASHCFLLKEFQSVGLEDFDNVMRGDGRTGRDFFSDHAQIVLASVRNYSMISFSSKWFRFAHGLLLVVLILVILLGLSASLFGAWVPRFTGLVLALVLIEAVCLFALYRLGALVESIE